MSPEEGAAKRNLRSGNDLSRMSVNLCEPTRRSCAPVYSYPIGAVMRATARQRTRCGGAIIQRKLRPRSQSSPSVDL